MPNLHTWNERIGCGFAGGSDGPNGHALPGDGPRWPRDREVEVRHTRLEVVLDVAAKSLEGTVTHTVRPFEDGTSSFTLDAIDMDIRSVTNGGRRLAFTYDGRRLLLELPRRTPRGTDLDVTINYAASPRIGLYFIGPDEGYPDKPRQVWSQNQDEDGRFWFPCQDFVGFKHSFELIATVPGAWFALSNGVLLSRRENSNGTATFHWRQDKPLATYLATLAAGEFERIDASRPDLTIDYYVEAADRDDGERTFANTPAMITLFEEVTGTPYPWDKYSQVVVRDFVFGGMENTSATTMTRNIIVDRKAAVDFTSDDLISHELAHMWFGDLLTCRDWSHGWLNESFATYLEMLWDERRRGIDEYRMGAIVNTDLYLGERYRRPIVSNVFHEPIDIFDRHLYEKGSVVLHMLRQLVGDDAFFRTVRRYAGANQHKSVLTQDLADAFRSETGRDLSWFFDQWVYRPGHPKLTVGWSWDDRSRTATVTVKQTQETKDGAAIFRLPVTIDFITGNGKPVAFPVEVTQPDQAFVFSLPAKPDLCRFDPHNAVLKEIEFDKQPKELLFQLANDDDISGRRFAAAELGKKATSQAVEALEKSVMGDRFWGVQAAAAKALGVARTTAARDALVGCLAVRHPKARRAVVAALGDFRGDDTAFEAILPFARRDRSWFVEAEAHRSIGRLRVRASFDVLVEGMARDSWRQLIRQGCIDGFVELRDERAFPHLLAAAKYGAPQQARQFATGAIGRLGTHFEARKSELTDELLPLLDDPDFRVRVAAANALKALKDGSHAEALDRMAARELDGRGVRAARDAALSLRKGPSTEPEVRNLRDEFEKLKTENAKLRERIERLEPREP